MGGSRNFCQGGSRPYCQKTALTFFVWFLFLNLFYNFYIGLFQRKLSFSKVSEGVHLFPGGGGGGPTFSRGVLMLICIETHRTFFQGGGSGPPIPTSGSALDSHSPQIPKTPGGPLLSADNLCIQCRVLIWIQTF